MLSEKKIRMMIRLSNYEQGIGKEDIYRVGYYKSDYIRLQILKTILCVSAAVVMLAGLVALYNMEYLIRNAIKLDYVSMGSSILILYILLLILFSMITISVASRRYDESKKRASIYYRTLNQLMDFYEYEDKDEGGEEN